MTQRSNYTHVSSISPSRLCKNVLKQNHDQSLNSNIDSRLKASISTRQHSESGDHLYTLRLQSKILEMQKKIDQQKFQIDTLTLETQNYMKICEEQKKELSNANIEILKQEYEQQISDLICQKEKLSDLIQNLSEEYQLAQMQQQKQLALMKSRNSEFAARIQQAMDRKELLLGKIVAADKEYSENQDTIVEQEERIDSLRNIQRKLFIALREIQSLDKK